MTVSQRREREREERRTAIIDAAEEVFVESGYWAATMDQVASRAELSKGTLYLYFKSKDDLFIAMGSRVLDTVVALFREVEGRQHEDGAALVRELLRAYSGVALSKPGRFRIAISRIVSMREDDAATPGFHEHLERVAEVISHIVGAIERGIADGSIRGGQEPRSIATYAWASMFGALILRTSAKEFADACPSELSDGLLGDAFIDTFLDTLVAGLRSGET